MKEGRYVSRLTDYNTYRSSFFVPYQGVATHCCGWDAFRTIAWDSPPRKFGNLTMDNQMVGALKSSGITVIPLSVCSVTNRISLDNLITEKHVVLISQMFKRNEGSWCVLYDGKIYHNCEDETEFFHPLEFINRPILSAYLVWDRKWTRKSKRYLAEQRRLKNYSDLYKSIQSRLVQVL